MSNVSPTIVAASMDDEKLKKSIEQMVQNLNDGLERMKESTDSAVDYMQKSLQKLGNVKVDSGGAADGGSSKRAKHQNEETDAVQKTTAARKEYNATLDQTAQAMQKSAGGSKMSVIETYDMQIELLKNRLREVRQDIDIFNTAIGSGKKTQVEWGQQGLKQAREEAELLMKQITALESKRGGLQSILAPQGDTIKNFVQSLQKANPELALLNQQYKEGNALLQQRSTSVRHSAEEERRLAAERAENVRKEIAFAATTTQRERERQTEIARSAIAAQTLSRELIRNMSLGSADISTNNYDRLTSYLRQMQQLYYNIMPVSERESPVGRALKNDIEIVEKARLAIMNYAAASKKILSAESESNTGGNLNLEKLRSKIKELTAEYEKLTVAEINAGKDKGIVDQFQRISRAAQILQKNLSTPISFNAVNRIQVKTLDDMVYKMRQLNAYKQSIDLTRPDADRKIREVDAAIVQLKKDMDKYMTSAKAADNATNALTRSLNYMKNRLAFYFTVGASTAFVKNLINIRGQYELLERSIGILFDSMQTGTKIFSELNAMAIKSPFTTMELGAAAKQLSAYNIAAKDVVDTTRRLADIAAAVGVPIERLTYALGQIKSYGYLNSRDARMFANAGIPLIQNLADMYTKLEGRLVSIGDVYDRIKHKQVSFEDTLKVVNEMTDEGGRFFNFQEKAADTLVVRLANLTLAWNNMMNELGKDNTGIINSTLGGLKTIFEYWRDIDAAIWGVVKILGIAKSAQFIWLMFVRKTGIELALANTFGQKLGYTILGIATSLQALAANPLTWIAAAVVSLGYLYQKWSDLQEANESFNKSISDGAQENINSINKFFDKYRKEIDSIGSASSTDQEKMWERIREEIEKTTKNAQQYIDILENIPDAAERVGRASGFLEQQQILQQEAKRMADHGLFDLGGGFANDTLAKDLQEYEKTMNDVLKKYNSLEDAQKDFNDSMVAWSSGHYAVKYYNEAIEEAEKELDDFTSILDKANLARVMGEGSDEERLANIRSFAQLIRDNFLATEEGQKISAEGQARLNKEIDYWIAQQGVSNGLIKEQRAEVEANRSAWETFFTYLNADQKKALDYLVSTGQTSSDEFKKIWNGAADEMKKSSLTAYEQIQSHIADLRKTAPIVINVVYRETKESKDDVQKDFEKRFTTPKVQEGLGKLAAEAYLAEQKRLNTIYGRFNKKTGEDMVEWEKRLGQEYQDNEKKLTDYNKMLEGYNKLSDEQKKKREAQINAVTKERDELKATQDALKEIQTWENFDFEQFKKGKKGGGSKKDFLGEAFAKVVEVTGNIQKRFKEYKQAGVDANTALEKSTQEYEKTLENANATLAKYGIKSTKSGNELAKMKLRDLRTYYESLLAIASGVGNTKGVEALEKAIASLNVEITKIDYKKITDGLNNELGRLKDEYELALDLDANPELGDVFADMMGLDKEQLAQLPRDFEGVMVKLQKIIDEKLGNGVFNLRENLNKASFESWLSSQGTDLDNERAKILNSYIDYANKVRQDETKKQVDEWNKLLEKYAEYEYKRKMIAEEAARELEIARKKGAGQDIIDAIEKKRSERTAQTYFEEFQQSPMWITATGELANMSKSAISMLIDEIEDYREKAKNLTPKQINQINKALRGLYKEQRQGNPFGYIGNMLDRAREKMELFDEEISKTQEQIDQLSKKHSANLEDGIADDDTQQKLKEAKDKLSKLKETRENVGKIDATAWVGGIYETINACKEAIGVFDGLAKAIGGVNNSDLDKVFSVIESAGKGASTGATFGGYGAIIGAVVGAATGLINTFADVWNGNENINKSIEVSTQKIRTLEREYKRLEKAVDDAYGTDTIGAQRLMMLNKEAELAELERQLELEKSRKAKNRDKKKIDDLRDKIEELRYEVDNAAREIILDLLEIGDAQDWANNFVKGMIDAFREGERYMKSYDDAFRDMIDNMIAKAITGKVIGERIEQMISNIQDMANARAETDQDVVAAKEELDHYITAREHFYELQEDSGAVPDEVFEKVNKKIEEAQKKYEEVYSKAATPTPEEISSIREQVASWRSDVKEEFDAYMDAFGVGFGSAKKLSELQQGISGITETTANALEAYMNGVSQQVYLHGDLLTQIRDAVVGFSMDVQLGAMSQILLQLQMNYQITESIHSMMSGWNNPAGNAMRVELI